MRGTFKRNKKKYNKTHKAIQTHKPIQTHKHKHKQITYKHTHKNKYNTSTKHTITLLKGGSFPAPKKVKHKSKKEFLHYPEEGQGQQGKSGKNGKSGEKKNRFSPWKAFLKFLPPKLRKDPERAKKGEYTKPPPEPIQKQPKN